MLDHLGLTTFETYALWAVLGVAILGLLYAVFLRRQVLREDTGTPQMREVWEAIRTGADAYLNRQLRTILPFIVILTDRCSSSASTLCRHRQRHTSASPSLTTNQLQLWIGLGPCRCLHHGRRLQPDGRPDRHAHGRAGQRARGRRVAQVALAARCALPTAPAPSPACSPTAWACSAARSSS